MNVMKILLTFFNSINFTSALHRLSLKNTNHRTEPKHIFFLSHLLLLFKFCHICKADNPTVETTEIGTEAVVKTTCNNPQCQKEYTWYSQPLIPGYRIPQATFCFVYTPVWWVSHKRFPDVSSNGPWLCLTQHILQLPKGLCVYYFSGTLLR